MSKNIKKVKLTDRDKKIIIQHSNICTDSHNKSCILVELNEHNKNLN